VACLIPLSPALHFLCLYVRAAVIGPTSDTGRHDLLRQAMAADPLLDAMLEPPEIEALTSEMLAVNAPFLPQFEL
jgi:alpha-galactosidase/6-phospho-beta-glucosidase family protein